MGEGGAGANEPFHRLTPDDRGSIVVIVAYSWIIIAVIVAFIRFGIAWKKSLRFKVDDGTFLFGTAFAIASSVCFSLAVDGGLGKHMTEVEAPGLDQFYKMVYAGELLGVIAMAFAKTSVVLLSDRVAPRGSFSYNLMLSIVILWAIFSTFAIAFQCSLPHPWVFTPTDCPSSGNLYYPIIAFNLISDAILATWILPTLWKLLLDTDKRVMVVCLFGARLIVCCFEIVQLTSLSRHIRSADVTFSSFGRVLWGTCVTHLSVIFATLPRTNRFISALHSGRGVTTLLNEFELAQSTGQSSAAPKGLSTSTSAAITTAPDIVVARTPPSSRAHSISHSDRSREPLVELPLQLTPSAEQKFSTRVVSEARFAADGGRKAESSTRYKSADWRKYMTRNRGDSDDMNVATMFSFNSRVSRDHERIVQTREVTQEVEVVTPKESRWMMKKPRKLSRGE